LHFINASFLRFKPNKMKKSIILFQAILLLLCSTLMNELTAQCQSSTYSTNAKDSWQSCQKNSNPNVSRGTSHWIQYDLGYVYRLSNTHFWNYNVAQQTQQGFKQIAIDYSLDGQIWKEAGSFQLAQASGTSDYVGTTGLDLTGISARYILVTAISTWEEGNCAGLSEVRFDVSANQEDPIVSSSILSFPESDIILFPNPTIDVLHLDVGKTKIKELMIVSAAGHELMRRTPPQNISQVDVSQLPAGVYFVNIWTDQQRLVTKKMIKQIK